MQAVILAFIQSLRGTPSESVAPVYAAIVLPHVGHPQNTGGSKFGACCTVHSRQRIPRNRRNSRTPVRSRRCDKTAACEVASLGDASDTRTSLDWCEWRRVGASVTTPDYCDMETMSTLRLPLSKSWSVWGYGLPVHESNRYAAVHV